MYRCSSRRRGCLLLRALQGVAVGLVVAVAGHFACILLGPNFHAVLPGRVYRSAQLSPTRLEAYVRAHGIRSIVNLRGCCSSAAWYQAEADTTAQLDIDQEDISFSAVRLPSVVAVRQLVEAIDRCQYPILLHCQQGADRTGMASVMVMLLLTEVTLEEARTHLGPATGHVPLGRTAHVGRFFALYRDWLHETGRTHSSPNFREWAMRHYCPVTGRATFELVKGADIVRIKSGQPRRVTVRCHNRSIAPWRFAPGITVGTHGAWTLLDDGLKLIANGRTGLRRAEVAPGESIDLDVPLPPLPRGRYTLYFDLIDEQLASFMQLGNEMLTVTVEVE